MQAQLEDRQRQIDALQGQVGSLTEERALLFQQADGAQRRAQAHEQSAVALAEEVERARTELAALKRKLDAALALIVERDRALAEAAELAHKLESTTATAHAERDRLKAHVDGLQKRLADAASHEREQAHAHANAILASRQANLATAKERDQLRAQIESLQASLRDAATHAEQAHQTR